MEVNRFISTSDHDQDVVDFLNAVYDKAAEKGWSDLHFETLLNGDIEVRARILGQLSIIETLPKHMAHTLDIKMRYRCDLDVADNRLEQDGRFMQECHGRRIDVRYNRVTTTNGFSKVTRLLDSANAGKPIENLYMPPAVEQAFRAALTLREGLILTTGPTGSGKTTTLYAGLGHLNQVIRKIITAEDPVEYSMERAQQIPVGQGTGRTFHTALRAMMRQDPDVILVGEIRDQETAVAAMRAGMTGHLVLSTLHANSAVDTYFRLEDLGVPRHILAASVKIIIAQRIIKIVCPHCAEEHPVEFPEFFTSWGMEPPETEMVGAGCEACSGVRYISRMALLECIRMTKEFRDALGNREAMQRVADSQPQYEPLAKTALDLVLQKKTNSSALVEGLSDAE